MKNQPLEMQTTEHKPSGDSSLYVRWNPERSAYGIELSLEVATRLAQEVRAAEELGIEIGGLFFGTHPNPLFPTIRIDEFRLIPRRPEDGPVFMLDPKAYERVIATKSEAQNAGRAPVGFFRTNTRQGTLRPSLADKLLVGGEFKDNVNVILLIQASRPHTAAFFVASPTDWPEEPSVREFLFDEAGFNALPEMEPEIGPEPELPQPAPRRALTSWYVIAVLFLVLAAAAVKLWFTPSARVAFTSSAGIELAVSGDQILRISWNHSSPDIGRANSAKLIIVDGANRREVPIGPDELRLGTVEYQRTGASVEATLVLEMPDTTSISQSVAWHS
ncbi:MAG: hypothetical protein JOZ62_02180 [Acidobacteriaceae bacterium]|nr:hypothetical protein [Acidobacteriaceae bacterium]